MPPSSVVRLEPRSGVLREPLIVVPVHRRPAVVADEEDQRVLLELLGAQLGEHLADGVVHRRASSRRRCGAACPRSSANCFSRASVACIGVCTALNAR